jgi:hypothetical protein
VRSDTDQAPFVRSQELALEALETFRRADHEKGQIRSLIAASATVDARTRETMLLEAETIAEKVGDEESLAGVIAARARALAMSDRVRADELHIKALELFRKNGNLRGQARCFFSLSIGHAPLAEKRDNAIEAARLYRAVDDPAEASRCITIAIMNAEEIQPLADLEDLAREGLEDALKAGDRYQERSFYTKLAAIARAKGQTEQAEKYLRWEKDLEEFDGLTPLERWKSNVEMAKMAVAMAKAQGNKEVVRMFRDELKRLKATKPPS